MDSRAEFESLLAGVLDGPGDPAGNARLCELLRAHPEFQADYLDHFRLHALLRWRGGRVVPSPLPADAAVPAAPIRPRARRPLVLSLAALVLLALGAGLWLLPSRTAGPSDLIERLIDWNLDLALADSAVSRNEIYNREAGTFRTLLARAPLPPEDRELAESLLETSSWLTTNDDPMAEAGRFSELADRVVSRLDAATDANDPERIARFAESYRRLTELGVDPNLERAAKVEKMDPERKKKLKRTLAGRASRAKRMEDILRRHPEASGRPPRWGGKGHSHRYKTRPGKAD